LWESRSSPTLIRSLLRNQGAFFLPDTPPRPSGTPPGGGEIPAQKCNSTKRMSIFAPLGEMSRSDRGGVLHA
jgi:hypothetical protein